MSIEDKNPYNFYNHIENIEMSLNWLKTIHVHTLSDREYSDKEFQDLKTKVEDQAKQLYDYELDLNGLRLEIEHYKSKVYNLEHTIKIKEKEISLLKEIDEHLVDTQKRYNKIPWIFRKLSGAE
jgi:chromosome segregation ATPase